jgi:hypothetical protein
MRYFLSGLLAAAWALWFGGLVGLFLFINGLFQSMQAEYRPIFDIVAPHQFAIWERYEMVVGAFALLVAFSHRLLIPSRGGTWLFGILAIAGAMAGAKPLFITRKMFALVHDGLQHSDEFRSLHGLYMALGLVEAIFLLIAAFSLPAVMAAGARRSTAEAQP